MVFRWLESLWGPHNDDSFASPWNSQTERFNSRFWAPGTEAVDAFTCDRDENNWLAHCIKIASPSSGGTTQLFMVMVACIKSSMMCHSMQNIIGYSAVHEE